MEVWSLEKRSTRADGRYRNALKRKPCLSNIYYNKHKPSSYSPDLPLHHTRSAASRMCQDSAQLPLPASQTGCWQRSRCRCTAIKKWVLKNPKKAKKWLQNNLFFMNRSKAVKLTRRENVLLSESWKQLLWWANLCSSWNPRWCYEWMQVNKMASVLSK